MRNSVERIIQAKVLRIEKPQGKNAKQLVARYARLKPLNVRFRSQLLIGDFTAALTRISAFPERKTAMSDELFEAYKIKASELLQAKAPFGEHQRRAFEIIVGVEIERLKR